jgi:hypothetical protein
VPGSWGLGASDLEMGLEMSMGGELMGTNGNERVGDESELDGGNEEIGGVEDRLDFLGTVERFRERNPGISVQAVVGIVVLGMIGERFRVEMGQNGSKDEGIWVVRKEGQVTKSVVKAMMDCVESRKRKGDLRFLLVCLPFPFTKRALHSRPRLPFERYLS